MGQPVVLAVAAAGIAPLLGHYFAAVHGPGPAPGDRVFAPTERLAFRLIRVDPEISQRWQTYALSVVAFGVVSVLWLFLILQPGAESRRPRFHRDLLCVRVRRQRQRLGVRRAAVFLLSVVLIFGGLTYLPALALGPAADQLGL